jgi:hypothetical protein
MSSVSVVTGYWPVKNKHDEKYNAWFKTSLRINCPYIIYGPADVLEGLKQYRQGLPTEYRVLDMTDFVTAQFRDRLASHPVHAPSVDLHLIWHEKVFLLQRAMQENPFGSEWFVWADAGLCTYRSVAPPQIPWPEPSALAVLPRDKFIFTSSDRPFFEPRRGGYYHYVSGTYMMHRTMIDSFCRIYMEKLDELLDGSWIYTDQVVHTLLFRERPELFYKIADGYGAIFPFLFK